MAKRKKNSARGGGAGYYDDAGNWVDLESGDSPKKTGLSPARKKIIRIVTGLAILIAGVAYFIVLDNARPRARKKVYKREEVVANGMRYFRRTARTNTTSVAQDILKLDKVIYQDVRFVLDTNHSIKVIEKSRIGLKRFVITLIEIDIRSKPWDALKSDERIRLLYNTYRLLKNSYPEITLQVRLVFDDKQRSLDFEFDKMFS